MKAACCGQEIVIQTDPKNTLYVIMSGAKQKTETYDEVDAETVLLPEQEGAFLLHADRIVIGVAS